MLKLTFITVLLTLLLGALPAHAGKKEYVCGGFPGPFSVPCIERMLPAYPWVETSNAYIIGGVIGPKGNTAIWNVRTRIFYEDGTNGACYSVGMFDNIGRFRLLTPDSITCGPE